MTPEQIDAYCKRLAEAWKKIPDEPLGRLIDYNLWRTADSGDSFRVPDEALITAIERMVEK